MRNLKVSGKLVIEKFGLSLFNAAIRKVPFKCSTGYRTTKITKVD